MRNTGGSVVRRIAGTMNAIDTVKNTACHAEPTKEKSRLTESVTEGEDDCSEDVQLNSPQCVKSGDDIEYSESEAESEVYPSDWPDPPEHDGRAACVAGNAMASGETYELFRHVVRW